MADVGNLEERVRRLEVIVVGDHEYRTPGMADQFDKLVEDVQDMRRDLSEIRMWIDEQRKAAEKRKKIFGWFAPGDLGKALGLVIGTVAVLKIFGWLK